MKILEIYTDGACSGNPGPGGYAAVIIDEAKEHLISGHEKNTTNNRMEMMALIKSLEYVRQNYDNKNILIKLFVDSQYVMKGATEWMKKWKQNGWKSGKTNVKNQDLWVEIDKLIYDLKIEWTWVKGHNDNKYNELVDKQAVAEIKKVK